MTAASKDTLIGHTIDGKPVYDYAKLIDLIAQEQKCDAYEAADWITHNYIGVKDAPIIVQRKEDAE